MASHSPDPQPGHHQQHDHQHDRRDRHDWHDQEQGGFNPWNLLLAVPIVLSLLTTFYNRDEPRLFGFPAFYWLQLAFVIVGVTSTTLVYQLTKRRD